MLIIKKMIVLFGFLALLGIGTLGCDREGPAERAGQQVDEAAEETGEKMEEAAEEVDDYMEKD